jgi:hypothetical protein
VAEIDGAKAVAAARIIAKVKRIVCDGFKYD